VRSGRLSFAGLEDLAELAREGEVIFIAVDTPKGRADLPISRAWRRSPGV
jgi:hypothetical protein